MHAPKDQSGDNKLQDRILNKSLSKEASEAVEEASPMRSNKKKATKDK